MSGTKMPSRTYNQSHVPRRYIAGQRRVSLYWTWSYPWEANRDPAVMDNRFSTFTEVRRVAWPDYETCEWDEQSFLQGIAGTLELFHRSTLSFQQLVGETTGHPVAVFQRIDQAGYRQPLDERVLADTDTLMVFGLDHLVAEQEAAPEEIAALVAAGHPYFATGQGNRIGIVLDDATDWDEVDELVRESYRLLAPKKLVALLEDAP